MKKQSNHVFAIVRVDNWPGITVEPRNMITVKKIVCDIEIAIAEVDRLNKLNQHESRVYFWQTTRFEEYKGDNSMEIS